MGFRKSQPPRPYQRFSAYLVNLLFNARFDFSVRLLRVSELEEFALDVLQLLAIQQFEHALPLVLHLR